MSPASWTESEIRALLTKTPPPGLLERAIDVTLSGWGYDYHAPVARLRENDQVVRRLATAALVQTHDRIRQMEVDYRHEHVPPATRAKPFPPEDVQNVLGTLHGLGSRIKDYLGVVDAMEVPGADHHSKRLANEKDLIAQLVLVDVRLVLAAQQLRDAADRLAPSATDLASVDATLRPILAEFEQQIRLRRSLIVG